MSDVRIYWDVDGVINSFHKDFSTKNIERRDKCYDMLRKATGWDKWFNVSVRPDTDYTYTIVTATDLLDAMTEVALLPNVEPVWLTTWQGKAADPLSSRIRLSGGSNWRVLHWEMDQVVEWAGGAYVARNYAWKVDAMLEDTKDFDGVVVWVDDDMDHFKMSQQFDLLQERLGDRLHLVVPETWQGLTKPQMCGIIDFVTTE